MSERNNKSISTRGFTLIELLIVIAVIGVLMAFLFPTIRDAIERAKRTQQQTFLKGVEDAIRAYHLQYGVKPYKFEIVGTNYKVNIQDLVRLLNPGNKLLTVGALPSSAQTHDFIQIPKEYIQDGRFLDIYGTEPRIKVEVSRPLNEAGNETRVVLYSLGKNKHDETDLRLEVVSSVEDRIPTGSINVKQVSLEDPASSGTVYTYDDITTFQ